jgi:hypothetical protein
MPAEALRAVRGRIERAGHKEHMRATGRPVGSLSDRAESWSFLEEPRRGSTYAARLPRGEQSDRESDCGVPGTRSRKRLRSTGNPQPPSSASAGEDRVEVIALDLRE